MGETRKLWLVRNADSGSNNAEALRTLEDCCGTAGFHIERSIAFPKESTPTHEELDEAGVDLVAVFAGDGTTNAVITGLYGWGGAILVLPGGTMNLLCKRLHEEADLSEIVARAAAGRARPTRPTVVRTRFGDALGELLAGPGTAWNHVREALRTADVAAIVDGAAEALEETTAGSMLVCEGPSLGRRAGYPLLLLRPQAPAIDVEAYHAESPGELVRQGLALLRRNFREGPHEQLGEVEQLAVRDSEGEPIGLLIDGEPASGGPRELFRLARCGVDLLASAHD